VESPWTDAAATEFNTAQPAIPYEEFVLLGREPALNGYLDRIERWVSSPDSSEQFYARAFFTQLGYVGFLADEFPDSIKRIAENAPYTDRRINGLLFSAYSDEILRNRPHA